MLHLIFSLFVFLFPTGGCIFEDGLYRAQLLASHKSKSQPIIVDIEGCLILRIQYPNKTIIAVKSEELDDDGHGMVQLPNGEKMEVLVNIQEPVKSY